ncbi:uncharacterized protein LOC144068870 [Stigmatopora argus]
MEVMHVFLYRHTGGCVSVGTTQKKIAESSSFNCLIYRNMMQRCRVWPTRMYICVVLWSFKVSSAVGSDNGNRKEVEPSFFKLEAGNQTACLANGFSRHNAAVKTAKGPTFKESNAVQISQDFLYNQVSLLPAAANDLCEEGDKRQWPCQDALVSDKKVNLFSITVVALRLVFAKTLSINCVMTLRLVSGIAQ